MSDPRRNRWITIGSIGMLVVLCGVILATPRLRQITPGPSAEQVAFQREQARAADLKKRLDEATAKLSAPRPVPTDRVALARADDLSKQLGKVTEKLKAPRPIVTDGRQKARADDLQRQLVRAVATIKAPRKIPVKPVKATKTKAQIIASKKMYGLYTAQSPFQYSEFNLVQDAVGRDANISGYFQDWTTDFRPDAVKSSWSRGDIPLLTWESQDQVGAVSATSAKYSLPRIIDGDFDAYLTRYAKGVAALKLPLIIRFDHEMNGNWYPWSEVTSDGAPINGNNKGDYAKMWRHVHDVFEKNGANKYVAWLWSPNRINAIPNMPAPKNFYPGDKYVDIIGMSGYYRPYDDDPTFAETFGQTLPLLREASRRKPIILAEIGATEDHGNKVTWINDLFENLAKPENSDIMGFVWFNFSVTSSRGGSRNTNDWRITSTASATKAFASNVKKYAYGLARSIG